MQVPKHVTSGQTRDQQFLGVVARAIPTESWIARSGKLRLATAHDRVIAAIRRVGLGALTIIPRPVHTNIILVLLHAHSLQGALRRLDESSAALYAHFLC